MSTIAFCFRAIVWCNRVEEGFIVTDDGLETLSKLISELRQEYLG